MIDRSLSVCVHLLQPIPKNVMLPLAKEELTFSFSLAKDIEMSWSVVLPEKSSHDLNMGFL